MTLTAEGKVVLGSGPTLEEAVVTDVIPATFERAAKAESFTFRYGGKTFDVQDGKVARIR